MRCFVQIETSREGGNLMWEKLVEEAKCQERVSKEYAKECGICKGKNHYRAVCRKAAQMQAGGGTQPKFEKQGKGKSPGKNGKAKAKHTHSIVFKTVPSAKGIVSGLEGASASNSVTSEPSVPLSLGVQ